jgi:hypothetical protein
MGIVGGIIGAGMGGGCGFGLFFKINQWTIGKDGIIFNDDGTANKHLTGIITLIYVAVGVIIFGITGARSGRFYFKRMFAWLEFVLF